MGLEKRQNEAGDHESQEDQENYAEVWIGRQSEEKEPVQTNDEEEFGAQDIPQQTRTRVSSGRSFQSFLHRYYLHTVRESIRIPVCDQRCCNG